MRIEQTFDSALLSLSDGKVEGHRYLIGVSGGIDSMCMAELFLRSALHPQFAVAHVNFSLRGDESDGDMLSVEQWGRRNGIHVYTKTFDTKTYAAEHSLSTQMAARELRYGFFSEIMERDGFDYLSIAHNLDDSIETIFLNIARGTGLRGLAGIPMRNGRIIRPLMEVSRAEIREYVAATDISYRDDHTNFESHYARNRIRNIIFPEFRKINPSFLNTVRRDSEYFREADEIIGEVCRGVRERVCSVSEDGVLNISTVKSSGLTELSITDPSVCDLDTGLILCSAVRSSNTSACTPAPVSCRVSVHALTAKNVRQQAGTNAIRLIKIG